MCDTLVALGNSTKDGSVVFGKNSDRPDDEVQLIVYVPHANHSKDSTVKCTYIKIPQVNETAAVLLSQPWWMWGAEMGANEHGVVIGNEAIHTHESLRHTGLLGMDLLRLGLERGKTAKDSVKVIIELLEKYHQGGGCAYGDSGWMYHNSFLIADFNEAYVLEAADDWWVVENVKDIRSISNEISIRGKGDLRRDGIIQYAIQKGYCKDDNDFDFAVTFSGSAPSMNPYSRGGMSTTLLQESKGNITPALMMDFLREHYAGICMHGGFESTGSQVSHLRKEGNPIHWVTGSTLPCVSVYKPYVFPIEGQKYDESGPYSKINPNWFWVRHARTKSRKHIEKIEKIENDLFSKMSEIFSQQESITEEDFINKVKDLNSLAWEKSEQLIK
ncbi:MAG: C69 family dipeptidase [Promethearchaeota archaeon]